MQRWALQIIFRSIFFNIGILIIRPISVDINIIGVNIFGKMFTNILKAFGIEKKYFQENFKHIFKRFLKNIYNLKGFIKINFGGLVLPIFYNFLCYFFNKSF